MSDLSESTNFEEFDFDEIENLRESGARNPHVKNVGFINENLKYKRINMKSLLNIFSD